MDNIIRFLILFLFNYAPQVRCDTYSVKIGTERFVNVVDSRFLSFTVDPKYLFDNSEKNNSQESVCMASSLTPAYIRIAGPSTSHLTFTNSTIAYTNLNNHQNEIKLGKQLKKLSLENIVKHLRIRDSKENFSIENSKEFGYKPKEKVPELKRIKKHLGFEDSKEYETKEHLELESKEHNSKEVMTKEHQKDLVEKEQRLEISNGQWKKFVHWAKDQGFDLVFALNNEDKNPAGLWNPNSAMDVLTMAQVANVSEIYWQLGYECVNQSVDDYINDLETLRVMSETFGSQWRTVGGDVTKCLNADSKSDFIDYVTLSEDMMDAVLLNGNSSSQELEKLSESDRLKLLKLLSLSKTPLWLTESRHSNVHDQLFRAADWISSLGYSARNGFAVHFRELIEEELFEPTLSFYMALLYKNLVGERVLNAEMEASQAVLFAHCTSLRHKPVPGAVTLYAANMDSAPARFSIKLPRREEGGDIMQFILSQDENGHIIVNGKAMYHEGDIRPIVKRVRPYRTLLVKLPAKSFGFWVLANTKIEACQDYEDDVTQKNKFVEAMPLDDEADLESTIKIKRSMLPDLNTDELNFKEVKNYKLDRRFLTGNEDLKKRVKDLNSDLNSIHKIFYKKPILQRRKRFTSAEDHSEVKKKFRYLKRRLEEKWDERPKFEVFQKILGMNRNENVRHIIKKASRFHRSKFNKKSAKNESSKSIDDVSLEDNVSVDKSRKRRSIGTEEKHNGHEFKHKPERESSAENEIDSDLKHAKLWKILHEIHDQIKDIENEDEKVNNSPDNVNTDINEKSKDEGYITVKTKLSDDTATVKYSESMHGVLKSTIDNIVSVLRDLNNNLNRFWSAFSFLE